MSGPLIFIGILLTLCCAVAAIYFMKVYYAKDYKISVMLKGLTGVFFVLFGLVKVIASLESLNWPIALVALALLLGLAGDELLALRHMYTEKYTFYFVIGALCFGAEHVLLMTSVLIDRRRSSSAIPNETCSPSPSQRGRYMVTSPEVASPPSINDRSAKITDEPARAAARAAAIPAIPPPTTSVSHSYFTGVSKFSVILFITLSYKCIHPRTALVIGGVGRIIFHFLHSIGEHFPVYRRRILTDE